MLKNSKQKCWNCESALSAKDLFCTVCKSVQPVFQVDHFTKLGMSISFEIGYKNLEVAYFALQRKLHPDLFINKSEKEKTLSLQQTMALNEAFDVLKSPLKRAEYILAMEGLIVNKDGQGIKPSQELLIESLDMRERLHEIKNKEDLRNVAVEAAEERLKCIDTIKDNFSKGKLENAAQNTIRLRYLEKLVEEVKIKEATL